jgi:pyruvate dehydrogenase kinase 2/3/4
MAMFGELRYKQMRLKLQTEGKGYEVSERKQVGDAESMVNEGARGIGRPTYFGEGGEV